MAFCHFWSQLTKEQLKGQAIDNATELLRFAAISRILEKNLGITLYRDLVRNDALCGGLLEFLREFEKELPFPLSKDRSVVGRRQPTPRERLIVERIEPRPAIREMLLSEPGQAWLCEKEKRAAVEDFLASTRPENRSPIAAKAEAESLGMQAVHFEVAFKDFVAAESFYKRAIDADPHSAINLGNYADFLEKVRKDQEAADAFYKRAISADPKHSTNLGRYATFLAFVRNEPVAAEAVYKRALDADSKDAHVLGTTDNSCWAGDGWRKASPSSVRRGNFSRRLTSEMPLSFPFPCGVPPGSQGLRK